MNNGVLSDLVFIRYNRVITRPSEKFEGLYICRECSTNQLFYAKQTQSQVGENQLKLFYNKQIRVIGHLVIRKKQSQTNPIKAKTKPIQTQSLPSIASKKPMRKPRSLRLFVLLK